MFGYDSGAINGTQEGLEPGVRPEQARDRLQRRRDPARLRGRRVLRRAPGRPDRAPRRDDDRRGCCSSSARSLAGAAASSAMFIIARFIGGIGVGAASVLSPVYISEVTPASIRGRLSSVQQIMIITGLTGAFVVNYVLAQLAGGSLGDVLARLSGLALDVLDAGDPGGDLSWSRCCCIPESPRYLVMQAAARTRRGACSPACSAPGRGRAQGAARSQPRWSADHTGRDFRDLSTGAPAGCARSSGPGSARGLPAARRHQHRLLLRRDAVAGGRLLRGRRAEDQHAVGRRSRSRPAW